jgi:hypothetical protein
MRLANRQGALARADLPSSELVAMLGRTRSLQEVGGAGLFSCEAPPFRVQFLSCIFFAHTCLAYSALGLPVLKAARAFPSSCILSLALLPPYVYFAVLYAPDLIHCIHRYVNSLPHSYCTVELRTDVLYLEHMEADIESCIVESGE